MFSNAFALLFQESDILANSVGLEELVKLRNPRNKEKIDRITGLGLGLTSARLANTNLNSANLTSANLTNANLTSANLNSANLKGANLNNTNLANATFLGTPIIRIKIDKKSLATITDEGFYEKVKPKGFSLTSSEVRELKNLELIMRTISEGETIYFTDEERYYIKDPSVAKKIQEQINRKNIK